MPSKKKVSLSKQNNTIKTWLKKEPKRAPPVSFTLFSKHIINLSEIALQIQRDGVAGAAGQTLDECVQWYYNAFYENPAIRERYEYKIRACPLAVREKLLCPPRAAGAKKQPSQAVQTVAEPPTQLPVKEVTVTVANSGKYRFPVSFETFLSYINKQELLAHIVKLEAGKDKAQSKKLLADKSWCRRHMRKFYNSFYIHPETRKRNKIKFENAPQELLPQLLEVGVLMDKETPAQERPTSSRPVEIEEVAAPPAADIPALVQAQPPLKKVEVTVENRGRFLFPVSYSIFKRYFDSIKLLKHIVRKLHKDNEKRKELINDVTWRTHHLTKYYHDFYISPSKRKLHKYGFEDAPPEYLVQLLEEAVPLTEEAPKTGSPTNDLDVDIDIDIESVEEESNSDNGIVSFPIFEKYVENLYDIVWDLKLNEPDYICMGFEDCAYAYYKAFYATPEIRDRYQCKLRPCPQDIRDRILVIPSKKEVEALQQQQESIQTELCEMEQEQEPELDVDILDNSLNEKTEETVEDYIEDLGAHGRYMFPVSFDIFKRYINYDELIGQIIAAISPDELKRAAVLKSPEQCEKLFRRYYRSFYMRCEVRDKYNYRFDTTNLALRQKLLRVGERLDEAAEVQTQNEAKAMKTRAVKQTAADEVEAKKNTELKKIQQCILPVTFTVFKKHLKNLPDIVEQLQRCEEHQGKSEDECARAYYKAFYTTPQIREEYEFQLKPCPVKMRDKLLCVTANVEETEPEQPPVEVGDAEQTHDSSNNTTNTSIVIESERILIPLRGITYEFPVSLQTFKQWINYDELIIELAKFTTNNAEEAATKLSDERSCKNMLLRFYHAFYENGNARKRFKYNFDRAPARLQAKLQKLAIPISDEAATYNKITESERPLDELPTTSSLENLNEKEDAAVQLSENPLPVAFNVFKRYLKNLPDIVSQMQCCKEHRGKSEDQCAMEYYKAFYTAPEWREKFEFKLKPCPAKMRNMLLSFAIIEDEAAPVMPSLTEEDFVANDEANNNNVKQIDDRIVVKIRGKTYDFPVSFQTFRKWVNYDDLKVELVDSIAKNDLEVEKMLTDERSCLKLLRRFYHTFYINTKMRKKFKYNFNRAPRFLQYYLDLSATCIDEVEVDVDGAKAMLDTSSSKSSKKAEFVTVDVVTTASTESAALPEVQIEKPSINSQQTIADHNYSQTPSSAKALVETERQSQASPSVDNATRAATIESMEKNNVVDYTPHNLCVYIAGKVNCPQKQAQAQQEFLDTVEEALTLQINNALLAQAEQQFLAHCNEQNNLKQLISSSHGLKSAIWRILSQLSFEEFKVYTSIYKGELLYENPDALRRIYAVVIGRGNWPINLFVKLQTLPALLQSKGIQWDVYDLKQLSPKMLHCSKLLLLTDFSDIVNFEFLTRTKKPIEDMDMLFVEEQKFFERCWQQDRWIRRVPKITEPTLNAEADEANETVLEMDTASPPYRHNANEVQPDNAVNEVEDTTQITSTVGNTSCDALPMEDDSVLPTQLLATPVQVKTEQPFKFLDKLRFTLNSKASEEFNCETISTEEQIINLDDEDEKAAADLACFALPQPDAAKAIAELSSPGSGSDSSPMQALNTEQQLTDDRLASDQPEASPEPELVEVSADLLLAATLSSGLTQDPLAELPAEQPQEIIVLEDSPTDLIVQISAEQLQNAVSLPTPIRSNIQLRKRTGKGGGTVPSKKPRLLDKVPQLRHEFRPLPMNAMCSIVPQNLNLPAAVQLVQQQVQPVESEEKREQDTIEPSPPQTITASQALSTDNSLFDSTQLQNALDAGFVTLRKVTELNDVNDNVIDRVSTPPPLRRHIVCRKLETYHYFRSLKPAHISQYHITCNALGESYHQALIDGAGQRCHVYGPLLQTLFPHCTASLLGDLQNVLQDLDEFHYNSRRAALPKTEDLRTRVLHTFMATAPMFTLCRLQYENETREWASCHVIEEFDPETVQRSPSCDLAAAIKPEILERIKQVKSLL